LASMEQRNLLLAIVISIGILIGFQSLFPPPAPPVTPVATTEPGTPSDAAAIGAPPVPAAPGGAPAAPASRETVLAQAPRLPIQSPRMHGSIALAGGRIDDVSLPDYHVTVGPESPEVTILSPPGAGAPYYAEFGWVGEPGTVVPGADAVWTTEATALVPGKPVTAVWDNGQGLRFF